MASDKFAAAMTNRSLRIARSVGYLIIRTLKRKPCLLLSCLGTRISLRGVGDQPSTTVVDSGRVARRGCIAATTGPRASSSSGPGSSPATTSPGPAACSASSGALLSPGTVCPSDEPVCQYHIEREGTGPGSAVSQPTCTAPGLRSSTAGPVHGFCSLCVYSH